MVNAIKITKGCIQVILCPIIFCFGFYGAANAQTPKKIKQIEAWAVYQYSSNNEKVCYALSMPIKSAPANVRHGDNFFLISHFSSNKSAFEPQFMADYPLQVNSAVKANIKGKNFTFFTKNSSAWLASAAQERDLIEAMRKGAVMEIQAISKRGTHTKYEFSLKGVTAALEAVKNCTL